jgi:hypothetical protein
VEAAYLVALVVAFVFVAAMCAYVVVKLLPRQR